MLKEEDKIFKNLYNEHGWGLEDSLKRNDWSNTKEIISKGREWIINEIKISELRSFWILMLRSGLKVIFFPSTCELKVAPSISLILTNLDNDII